MKVLSHLEQENSGLILSWKVALVTSVVDEPFKYSDGESSSPEVPIADNDDDNDDEDNDDNDVDDDEDDNEFDVNNDDDDDNDNDGLNTFSAKDCVFEL